MARLVCNTLASPKAMCLQLMTTILLFLLLCLGHSGQHPHGQAAAALFSTYALEDFIWLDLIKLGKMSDVRIDGFYHVSSWKTHWKDTVTEQLRLLDGDRLYSGLYMAHSGDEKARGGPQHRHILEETEDMTRFFNKSEIIDSIKSFIKKGYYQASSITNNRKNSAATRRLYNRFEFANSSWMPRKFTSLLSLSSSLNINIAGNTQESRDEVREHIESIIPTINSEIDRNKIILSENVTLPRDTWFWAPNEKKRRIEKIPERSEGECATHDRVRDHCLRMIRERPGKPSYVYYFHNKGACCSRGHAHLEEKNIKEVNKKLGVASWRELMNTFNLEYPSICVRALMMGYSGCGVNYASNHYSGNFWWADCSHIAALDPMFNVLDSFVAEYFLFNVSNFHEVNTYYANNCAFSAYNTPSNINLYDTELPKKLYKDNLLSFMYAFSNPTDFPETAHDEVSWKKVSTKVRLEICKAIKSGRVGSGPSGILRPKDSEFKQFRFRDINGKWNFKKIIEDVSKENG